MAPFIGDRERSLWDRLPTTQTRNCLPHRSGMGRYTLGLSSRTSPEPMKARRWRIVRGPYLQIVSKVTMILAAARAGCKPRIRHPHIWKFVSPMTVIWTNVLRRNSTAVRGLADNDPVSMFHSGVNYTPELLRRRDRNNREDDFQEHEDCQADPHQSREHRMLSAFAFPFVTDRRPRLYKNAHLGGFFFRKEKYETASIAAM